MKIRYIQLQIVAIISFSQLTNSFSHGMGGSLLGYEIKKDVNKYKDNKKIKSISERLSFTLKYQDNLIILRARDSLNQVMDISLSSATAFISGDREPSMLIMNPGQEGNMTSKIPSAISNNTKIAITLRLPGEWPIKILFLPMQSIKPIRVKQQKSRDY